MPFPIEFEECPSCRSKDTVCRLACADETSIPKGVFVSMEKVFTPIQDVTKLLGPLVKGILCHFDVCAKCGTRYCTRAEIANLPVNIDMAPQQRGQPLPRRR